MGLPRGRRWVDRLPAAKPGVALTLQRMKELAMLDTPAVKDPLALREQLHREAAALERQQGELKLLPTR